MKSTTAPLLAATSKSHRWLAALIVAACAPTLLAWTSGTGTPNATSGFVVDPANRLDDLSFYNCTYPASENYAANIAWTGSVASGIAGTTSVAFKDDVLRRINFYSALSALPRISRSTRPRAARIRKPRS